MQQPAVKRGDIHSSFLMLMFCGFSSALAQTWSFHGQASSWLTSIPQRATIAQAGLRYIPELSVGGSLGGDLAADVGLSYNTYAVMTFGKGEPPEYVGKLKPHRAWVRISSNAFEIRAGLQKINFGSATLFRPLMWFDSVDPRDPLQLTDGVYSVLVRYYFLDNANIWFWGLYGNNESKGWEVVPTTEKSIEYGGRVQIPVWTGELGATYHHREADYAKLNTLALFTLNARTPEDRFALDGKWNLGIGAWFEAALTHDQTDLPGKQYQRQWMMGADYTFDIGNGLTALTEYFRTDNPEKPFAPANGLDFSALSLNYPLGLIDRISGILYRDWSSKEWYRLVTWQRTYDNWMFYLLGFWNPNSVGLYRIQPPNATGQPAASPYAGTGIQLMLVFNH
jgi:hypothetical protein